MCQAAGCAAKNPSVKNWPPFTYQISGTPEALRQRMSSRPSPLKSPVPSMCQMLGSRAPKTGVSMICVPSISHRLTGHRHAAPQDVFLAVAVEISGILDVQVEWRVGDELGGDHGGAIDVPGADRAIAMAPEDVVEAVADGAIHIG